MANLTVRGLPDEVHMRLKESAKANRRSLNQEIIAELIDFGNDPGANHDKKARHNMIRANNEINRIRAKMKRFMTTEEIDASIDEGRR